MREDDNTMHSAITWHVAVDQLDEDEWGGQRGVTYGHAGLTLLALYDEEARRLADVPEPGRHARARENVLACVAAVHQLHHRWTAAELRRVAASARRLPGGWAELGREWLQATHPGFPVDAVRDLAAVGRYSRRPDAGYVLPRGETGPVWVVPHRPS